MKIVLTLVIEDITNAPTNCLALNTLFFVHLHSSGAAAHIITFNSNKLSYSETDVIRVHGNLQQYFSMHVNLQRRTHGEIDDFITYAAGFRIYKTIKKMFASKLKLHLNRFERAGYLNPSHCFGI